LKLHRLFYLGLFLLLLYLFVARANYLARFVYPFHYREIIIAEAQKNDLEPLLVAAVVWVESSFDKEAQSSKGARGLMQIMPETGLWVAEQIGMDDYTEEKLYDPRVNILIGTWYLRYLIRQFDDNRYAALAAYNGGRGRVSSWLHSGLWDGSREGLENIPFPETRLFVIKVEQTYRRYRQLYSTE
jgi:soluble lytic murein transglycosylase